MLRTDVVLLPVCLVLVFALAPKEAPRAGLQDALRILPGQIGSIHVCDPLASVNLAFRQHRVRDTVYHSEGVLWPGKRVLLSDGVIDVSSSWADTVRIWNISTTSPSVRSKRGFHVGMTLGQVSRVDSLEVELPEGAVVVSFRQEGIGALIDEQGQRRFYATYNFQGLPTAAMLSPSAVITALVTGGGCN
jgi:hypothetical protein